MAYYRIHVAVHLLLIRDNKILLLRRYNTGYEDGNYSVVAGHMTGNENVFQAMQREAIEEAGISIKIEDLQAVQVMNRRKPPEEGYEERIDYFFTAKNWEGEIRIMEPDKCDQLEWFDLDNLPHNMVPYVRQGIEYYNEGIPFTIYGW